MPPSEEACKALPLREALRQRGGAAAPRMTQERRSRSLTQVGPPGGNPPQRQSTGGIDLQTAAAPDSAGPGGADLRWLGLTTFAPKALLGAIEQLKKEDFATTAKEFGEHGFSMMQDLGRPRDKPKSKASRRKTDGNSTLWSNLQGRGGIILPDHLAEWKAAQSAQPQETNLRPSEQEPNLIPSLNVGSPDSIAQPPEERQKEDPAAPALESCGEGSCTSGDIGPQHMLAEPNGHEEIQARTATQSLADGSEGSAAGKIEDKNLKDGQVEEHERPNVRRLPSGKSRPSWVKDQSEDASDSNVAMPEEGTSSGSIKDLREYWNKRSVGFAGASVDGKRRLSRSEAQAALQRLVAAGNAMDFEQVRELRKLVSDKAPE